MPSNHLILCHPLRLLPSIFPSIRVSSNESTLRIKWPKNWSFSFSISPSNDYSGLISFRMDWLDLLHYQDLSHQGYGFSVVMHGCESWDYKESWAPKNWCFWTVVLEKTLASPLDCKEIQLVCPKGNNFWIFIGRTDAKAETSILWPPDAKNWLTRKDPDAGKDWRQKKKRATEDERVGLHYRFNGHELVQTPGDGEGQGNLACCRPWSHEESDTTWWLNKNFRWHAKCHCMYSNFLKLPFPIAGC